MYMCHRDIGSSDAAMSSSTNENEDLPPSYDQIVQIDSENAPLYHETFAGSIFGTSTIVTFELASGVSPANRSSCTCSDTPCDYTFVIRDFRGCVQANGKVSNLNITLQNVSRTKILQIHEQIRKSVEPPNAIHHFLSRACRSAKGNTVHTFEVNQNSVSIGFIKFADKEPAETCLNIYLENPDAKLLVKSLTMGNFAIFRDQSSPAPLCNIQIHPRSFTGKIIFYPETGVTTEEQLLCTAAAFAFKTTLTQLTITEENNIMFKVGFWGFSSCIIFMVVFLLLCWLHGSL